MTIEHRMCFPLLFCFCEQTTRTHSIIPWAAVTLYYLTFQQNNCRWTRPIKIGHFLLFCATSHNSPETISRQQTPTLLYLVGAPLLSPPNTIRHTTTFRQQQNDWEISSGDTMKQYRNYSRPKIKINSTNMKLTEIELERVFFVICIGLVHRFAWQCRCETVVCADIFAVWFFSN